MTTTYNIGNPDPGLEQAQICGVIKPVNVILTPPPYLINWHEPVMIVY